VIVSVRPYLLHFSDPPADRAGQAHVEPDLTVEMFLMDEPVSRFGALELVEPSPPEP
jgi:hypothetical protein